VQRYRITTTEAGGPEQTWVLLPDEPSARMQAEEHHQREKRLHVRVYREEPLTTVKELVLDLPPRT
jgi:hypothetical protein